MCSGSERRPEARTRNGRAAIGARAGPASRPTVAAAVAPDEPTNLFDVVGADRTWAGLEAFCDALAWAMAHHLGVGKSAPPRLWRELPDTHGAAWGRALALVNPSTKRVSALSAVRWYCRVSRARGRVFPPRNGMADDCAGLIAGMACRGECELAPSTTATYIASVRAVALRCLGESEDRATRCWPLLSARAMAWAAPRVDTRPAVAAEAFEAAVRDRTAPRAVRMALGFAWDTVSRCSDVVDEVRGHGASTQGPVQLRQMTVRRDPAGGFAVELVTRTETSRGRTVRIVAHTRRGSPATHPRRMGSARVLAKWLGDRRAEGAREEEPLWRKSSGEAVVAEDIVALLQRHTHERVSRHSIRIGSASAAVAAGLSVAALATLGGWQSQEVCRQYVRQALGGHV